MLINSQFIRNVQINIKSILQQRQIVQQAYEKITDSKDSAQALIIKDALRHVKDNSFTAQENEAFTAIEDLRKELLHRQDRISYGVTTDDQTHAPSKTIPVAWLAKSSKSYYWARVLFALIRHGHPKNCLELGTNMGISASYQASALKLNGEGQLWTLEGNPASAKLAQKHLNRLGLTNAKVQQGYFSDTLDQILEEMQDVHYAFIDGHHDEEATLEYFKKILPKLKAPGIIIFDDISWSPGMKRAWEDIQGHHSVLLSSDLFVMGIIAAEANYTSSPEKGAGQS